MKKLSLVLPFLFLFVHHRSQVVFCPPGGEWHYSFSWIKAVPGTGYVTVIDNVPVKYIKDSVMGSETVKVLSHPYFFKGSCLAVESSATLIKQKGDTVFMCNANTQNAWQILYNFSALPGDHWVNILKTDANTFLTYTVTVDSIGFIQLNNIYLKRLFVKYNSVPYIVTERIGVNSYLFNFDNGSCDGPADYSSFLCYQDNAFGLYQPSGKSCDYSSGWTGVSEWNNYGNIRIYPNPVSAILNVELQSMSATDCHIKMMNLLGQEVPIGTGNEEQEIELDLREFKSGVYFLQVFAKDKLIATEKVIKE